MRKLPNCNNFTLVASHAFENLLFRHSPRKDPYDVFILVLGPEYSYCEVVRVRKIILYTNTEHNCWRFISLQNEEEHKHGEQRIQVRGDGQGTQVSYKWPGACLLNFEGSEPQRDAGFGTTTWSGIFKITSIK